MVPTIESDESELFFKVITEAEPDSRINRSYLYYKHHLGTPICANLRFLAVFICGPGRSVGRN